MIASRAITDEHAAEHEAYIREEWTLFRREPDRATAARAAVAGQRVGRVLDVGCGGGQELLPFLGAEEELVRTYLERLVEEGYVARLVGAPARFQLTAWGVKEGGRRFADEFAGLTDQAHGECNNPNCSCKTLGPAACGTHSH